MNIYYTVKGDTNESAVTSSVKEAAEFLGVDESRVEDAGEVPVFLKDMDTKVDTSAYDEWEKSEFQNQSRVSF